ncbi:MAG TPA: glycosyltransferase family 2 protein [bacterium]|nr:glycosyltransferase family 2 protein [bacterium]
MRLSIIIPCYNERETIEPILTAVRAVDLGYVQKEIIIIDDGSIDGTREILKGYEHQDNIIIIYHEKNEGKGMAIRNGLKRASGEIIIIQDADLEYDPNDYPKLIGPIIRKEAKVVYGSRQLNPKNRKHSGWSYYLGGIVVTCITNFLFGTKLTDEPTCYKVFDTETIKKINLRCQRFEFCPEVTAKLAKNKIGIKEVPISYKPRNKASGKKINFRDGIEAIWTLIKYRFRD